MARRRLSKSEPAPEPVTEAKTVLLGFEHPKVICIDLPDEAIETLRAARYRVAVGTLGQPYLVEPADGWVRPHLSCQLPGFAEQEIVVVQHLPPKPTDSPAGRPPPQTSAGTLCASCRSGVIDTRPFTARFHAQDDVQRILGYGGIVICFAWPQLPSGLAWGRPQTGACPSRNSTSLPGI